MSSAKKSSPSRQKQAPAPPVDALNLPLPPVTLDFAIRGDAHRDGFYQRYIRKGDINDAEPAMVGKGGFGTAYRFTRDDSFTPPTSMMEATVSSGDVEMGAEKLRRAPSQRNNIIASTDAQGDVNMTTGLGVSFSDTNGHNGMNDASGLRRAASGNSRTLLSAPVASVPASPTRAVSVPGQAVANSRLTVPRSKAPAVVVVKVCRTPTSGSYDELPKTGIGRSEAKIAAQEIATGKPLGEHTRIVRGEARLLRFLQMCANMQRKKGSQSHVVRLLADIPLPKNPPDGGDDDDEKENYSGPPVPRLLIFERLVELDAELTPRGWAKNKRAWSVEKVELVSKDAVAGLAFLHEHNVVHGDLKPSNFMRDARTGAVKLIDLGASRRWVRLHNVAKERTTAVEELDQALREGHIRPPVPGEILCEGLGSLTGSPHFMAPEVLLQAGRYLSQDGLARNVLDDYMANRDQLPDVPSASLLEKAHHDFKRGWGVKADIWSWGCSVISLLLRTIDSAERPSSNSVCAFDFSFESDADALMPLWALHPSNDSLPRFHQWARIYPLRIMETVMNIVQLPEFCSVLSPPYLHMLQSSFKQVDLRPPAKIIVEYLEAHANSNVEYISEVGHDFDSEAIPSRPVSRAHSIARSVASSVGASLPDEPHNIDLTTTSALSQMSLNTGLGGDMKRRGSEQSLVLGQRHQQSASDMLPANAARPSSQQKILQNRLLHSSLGSPAMSSPRLTTNSQMGISSEARRAQMSRQPSLLASTSQKAGDVYNEDAKVPDGAMRSLESSIPAMAMPLGTDQASESEQTTQCDVEKPKSAPLINLTDGPGKEALPARCRRSTVTPANSGFRNVSQPTDDEMEDLTKEQKQMKQRRGSIFARMASSLSLRHSFAKMSDAPDHGSAQVQGVNEKLARAASDPDARDHDAAMEELVNDDSQEDEERQGRGRSLTLRVLNNKWLGNPAAGSRSSLSLTGEGARRLSFLGHRKPSASNLRGTSSAKSSLAPAQTTFAESSLPSDNERHKVSGEGERRRSRMSTQSITSLSSHLPRRSQDNNVLGLDLGAQQLRNAKSNPAVQGDLREERLHRRTRSGARQVSDSSSANLSSSPKQHRSTGERRATGTEQRRSRAMEPQTPFLQFDPYPPSQQHAATVGHGKGRSMPQGAMQDDDEAFDGEDDNTPLAARRQRSWSAFFKRKKHAW